MLARARAPELLFRARRPGYTDSGFTGGGRVHTGRVNAFELLPHFVVRMVRHVEAARCELFGDISVMIVAEGQESNRREDDHKTS